MPFTFNGIGSHYYGQQNFRSNPGRCSSCGFVGELRSYETRLWFVIVYIPIIPLGKKQILDYCPKCSRHKAIPLAKWKELESKTIQTTKAEVISRPDDAQTSLQFHSNLVVFNRQVEAQTNAEELRKRFSNDYDVQFYLGSYFENTKRPIDADSCFARALELKPDSLPARRAVGIGAINTNDLSRARRVLSFMEQTGPDQDPAVILMLAYAYQQQGDHGQALDLFRVVCRDFPELAKKDKRLRQAVIKTQTTQGGVVSILPRAALNRKLIWAVGIVVVILGGFLGFQWYGIYHQTLFLVNGFAVPAEIVIPKIGKFSIPPHNVISTTLPEGSYEADITFGKSPRQTVPFKLSNSLWQRFEENRTFILNAGCGAAIMEEVVIYSSNPDPNEQPVHTLNVNKPFIVLRDLDYTFTEFPHEINLSNGQSTRKRRVTVVREKMEPTIFTVYSLTQSLEQACIFAERHLEVEVVDEDLLSLYAYLSAAANRIPQALAFVKGYLHLQPVQIPWHRTYQILKEYAGHPEGLAAEYEQQLQQEPGNSALLYLRGRVATGLDEGVSLYDRSIAANPKNPYPWYAKGHELAMRGNFKAAEPLMLAAIKLNPKNEEYPQMLREVRLGNGNLTELDTELKSALIRTPHDMGIAEAMLEVLARRNRASEMAGLIKELTKTRPGRRNDVAFDPLSLELAACYIQGDLNGYLKQAAKVVDPGQKNQILFEGYLSLGKLAEADTLLTSTTYLQNAGRYLQLWLGWKTLGQDETRGQKWIEKARMEYAQAFTEFKVAAGVLAGTTQQVVEKIDGVTLPFQNKALLYLAAAQLYPAERAILLKRATAMNFHLTFPHMLIKAILASRGK